MDVLHLNELKKNDILTIDNKDFYCCKPTDLAKVCGVQLVDTDRCMPLIRGDVKPYAMLGKYGYLHMSGNNNYVLGLRPVLNYDELNIDYIKVLNCYDSITTFNYGFYPQTLINEYTSRELESKYKKHKLEKVNRSYSIYINGKINEFPVYKYNDMTFIVMCNDKLRFIEEKPLKFMTVPDVKDKVISVNAISGGIPFKLENGHYNNDLMDNYLNNILKNEIISKNIIKKNNKCLKLFK